jgi:uncharacterized membrane protein
VTNSTLEDSGELIVEAIVRPAAAAPSRTRFQTFLLVAAVILLNAFGDLSLTWGLRHIPQTLAANPLSYVQAMLNPFVAAGITMLILWLLTRMALMSWADLSFVLPVTSVGYVLVALLGRFFLHEQVSASRWVGILLILGGAILVGSSNHERTPAPMTQAIIDMETL